MIPSSVTYLADNAFRGCHRLKTIMVQKGDENRIKAMLPEELREFVVVPKTLRDLLDDLRGNLI